jgi:uncharacterized membrane protein
LHYGQVVLLMAGALLVGLNAMIGFGVDGPLAFSFVLALLMVFLGGLIGKVGPNALVGVRTFWALRSRNAWDKSNRLLGRLWFWAGLALFALAFVVSAELTLRIDFAVLLGAPLIAVFESWRVWHNYVNRVAG